MSLCASCGRQHDESARLCADCGAPLNGKPAGDAAPHGPQAARARTDAPHEETRAEPPADGDPFASWYQPAPPGGAGGPAAARQPTQTVSAVPGAREGYPASGFTLGNPFSSANPVSPASPPAAPAPSPAGPPRGDGRRGLFMTLAVVVVLAAGGGAYALATTLGKHSAAQPAASPPASVSSPAEAAGQASSPPASASAGPTPSPAPSLVAVAPGVAASAAGPQVEALLSHYFHGINSHRYAEYAGTLSPAERAKQTRAQFTSGYSTTSDSGMTLTRLAGNGDGGLTATVTFTSRQSPAQSIDKSACNNWTLNLYLVRRGTGYLIGPAPSGYQPAHSDC